MPLSSGSRLGPYQILGVIGSGGMGEVYRAKDTRLDRLVAIKVLPTHLSSNQNLKKRFEREARAVSTLNHPSICTLHDIGHQDGTDFLVMEYIEGETLASRLSKGALPLDQTLRYAIQIADALDKAHRQGIVHRDLKPGNIMITKSGVKLLDFGLAKYAGTSAILSGEESASALATEARDLTAEGTIIGTLQYMAPEQLEGKETDARTDIFAFGTVLYEMVTGKRAFTGKSHANLISAILKDEPIPVSRIQLIAPPALDRVVKTCLAKDPEERWQNAHDLMKELTWIAEGSSLPEASISAGLPKRRFLPWLAAASIFLVFVAYLIGSFNRSSPPPQKLMRLSISPPSESQLVYPPVISPDGSRIVFPAANKNGKVNLWVRALESANAQLIEGTEGASNPFWSQDSRSIGFFAKGKLMKVDPSEGHSQALCNVSDERGGTWNQNGVILFSPNPGDGLYRISSSGGAPSKVTSLDPAAEESSHRFPYFLPDGKHFIFFVRAHKRESGIYIGSLESKEKSFLLSSDRSGVFSSGYILFQRSNTLLAQAFDIKKLKLSNEAIPISENIWYEPQNWGTRGITVSDNNLLSYIDSSNLSQLWWFDRNGKQQGLVSITDQYAGAPSFSPDGRKFAMQLVDAGLGQVWLYDSSNGSRSRLTFTPSYNIVPRWSPDGTRILFASDRNGPFRLYLRDARGSGNEEMLYKSEYWCVPDDWSPDGQHIIFSKIDPKTKFDLWVLQLGKQRNAFPFLVTDANEANAMFSPDGKWVAYCSDESGQPEIYVQPFLAEQGGKWQISTKGGYTPRWSKDGKELFYLSLDSQIMSSQVTLSGTFDATVPRSLFPIHPYVIPRIAPWYDAFAPAPDGRFVVHSALSDSPPNITVVLNWPLLLNPKK